MRRFASNGGGEKYISEQLDPKFLVGASWLRGVFAPRSESRVYARALQFRLDILGAPRRELETLESWICRHDGTITERSSEIY